MLSEEKRSKYAGRRTFRFSTIFDDVLCSEINLLMTSFISDNKTVVVGGALKMIHNWMPCKYFNTK